MASTLASERQTTFSFLFYRHHGRWHQYNKAVAKNKKWCPSSIGSITVDWYSIVCSGSGLKVTFDSAVECPTFSCFSFVRCQLQLQSERDVVVSMLTHRICKKENSSHVFEWPLIYTFPCWNHVIVASQQRFKFCSALQSATRNRKKSESR